MTEYWLISAPGDKTCQQTFDTMNSLTAKQHNLCQNYKFHIPDLKVGTLDQLVGLSDDLGKLDVYVEQITRKVASYLGEVLEDQRDKLHENLLANNTPDPPDVSTKRSISTGKTSNLSNSRDTTTILNTRTTTTMTTTTTTCSNYHTDDSLINLCNHDILEHDYELNSSPLVCNCGDCDLIATTSGQSSYKIPPSTSAITTTNISDIDCYSQTSSSMFQTNTTDRTTACAITSSSSIQTNNDNLSSLNKSLSNITCNSTTSPTSCSTFYFSSSAPTNSLKRSSRRFKKSINNINNSTNNNNNCIINNNHNKLGLSNSASHITSNQQLQQQQQLKNYHLLHHHPQHHHHQNQHQQNNFDQRRHHSQQHSKNDALLDDEALKISNSTSDLSDTFDWWFHKRKRNSKKCSDRCLLSQLNINRGINFASNRRSSPVSSCCGSSSHGRSSPDTDLGEPPAFPLSPADLSEYLIRFQWDMAKYPIKQSLRNIADIISKQIGQIDADLKTKSTAYNNLKGSLQNLEKKQTGSLLTRNLADLVKKEHFILDSEYLTTLLVIVPKNMANDWTANYEKITDMIVPRSSTLITQDNDYCLFNVTLFKKVVEEFKLHARERKFIVREFVYNEEELAAGKNEITKLITDKKKQFGPLVRWLKVNFSEAFCALVHVKALRVFVESVLRYGLPVNFQAILIIPTKKSIKRLREDLNNLYSHLDGASAGGHASSNVDNVDIPGLGFGQSEYYPYVFYKINIDMVETSKI